MKKAITMSTISLFFLMGCTTVKQLNGTYHYGNSIEFKFRENPNEFEYFFRSEMGVLQYSTGKWELNKDKLELLGLGDDNIKTLGVESTITKNVSSNGTKVEIHYNTDNATTYIKSVVLINGDKIYTVAKDTIFVLDYKVETVQVKSYLSYTGLLSSPPKIDTLYSSKMKVDDGSSENKSITLKFTVHPYDFMRVKLTDTLTVKNSHTLYRNKTKLKKSPQ